MSVTQKWELERCDSVENNSTEVCPALPHKKTKKNKPRTAVRLQACPLRVRGKTLRTSFLEGKAAVKGVRRQVGNISVYCCYYYFFYISMTFF